MISRVNLRGGFSHRIVHDPIMKKLIAREKTPLRLMGYGVYRYSGAVSLRGAARAPEPLMTRSREPEDSVSTTFRQPTGLCRRINSQPEGFVHGFYAVFVRFLADFKRFQLGL